MMKRGITEKLSTRITFRLTPREVQKLHMACVSKNKNISEVITEKLSTRITFRLTPREVQKLHMACVSKNKNISEVIRESLKQTCEI